MFDVRGAAFTSVMGTVRLPALLDGVAAFTVGRVERSGDAGSAGTVAAAANGTRRADCCCMDRAATGCRARGAGGCRASGAGGGSGNGAGIFQI